MIGAVRFARHRVLSVLGWLVIGAVAGNASVANAQPEKQTPIVNPFADLSPIPPPNKVKPFAADAPDTPPPHNPLADLPVTSPPSRNQAALPSPQDHYVKCDGPNGTIHREKISRATIETTGNFVVLSL